MHFTVTPRYWVCLIGTNTVQAQCWHVGSKFLCRFRKFFEQLHLVWGIFENLSRHTKAKHKSDLSVFCSAFCVPAMQLSSLINETRFMVPWHVVATILDANTVGELDVRTGEKEGVGWIPALPDCQSTGLHSLQSLLQYMKSPISGPCPHQTL